MVRTDGGYLDVMSTADSLDRDVLVVGGGPAGLAAATWLGRYRRSTLVLDAGDQRNLPARRVHGYLGSDPVDPLAILERARTQLRKYRHVDVEDGSVLDARRDGDIFAVRTSVGQLQVARIVVATGLRDSVPAIEGADRHYGSSMFHCPSCDGFEASGEGVVVLGWGDHVSGFALDLLDWAASVTVVTQGRRFEGGDDERERLEALGIAVIEDRATALDGPDGDLRGVSLDGGGYLPASSVFFTVAHEPRNELARRLGCRVNRDGHVTTTHAGRTSADGVFAAGDLTPGIQLVQIAAAKGTAAGIAAAKSFHGERGAPNSPRPAPRLQASRH
jgi:thioredoxin reductase